MPSVKLRSSAKRNLRSITRYIARDNIERALSFTDELMDVCLSLAELPKRGVAIDLNSPDIRQLSHGNYLIFYRYLEDQDTVLILRISEHHQDMSRIKFED